MIHCTTVSCLMLITLLTFYSRHYGCTAVLDHRTTLPMVVHHVSKNILIIFDRNLKKDYQILIIFGTHIPDTTGNQTIT